MPDKINLRFTKEDIELFLYALRKQANWSDKNDKYLELIGEIKAQTSINIAKEKYLSGETRIRIEQSKMNSERERVFEEMNHELVVGFKFRDYNNRGEEPVKKKHAGLRKTKRSPKFIKNAY